ncbi:Uu.00g080970.m01.CDS01 [Anthostomella pinea]|uniref:Uu.00g080970.m01.CDS01 n=1 Tax=Anthostomella pinea TaxID=933095 RepID=A0AAI8VM18_9PEZI|nr:Uu.00g080970.m01.CDS01 [Anthostomella pinea]
MAPKYKTSQTVRYKPVGGPASNPSESTGKITDVLTEPVLSLWCLSCRLRTDGLEKTSNDNTGKMTTVYEKNIFSPA